MMKSNGTILWAILGSLVCVALAAPEPVADTETGGEAVSEPEPKPAHPNAKPIHEYVTLQDGERVKISIYRTDHHGGFLVVTEPVIAEVSDAGDTLTVRPGADIKTTVIEKPDEKESTKP